MASASDDHHDPPGDRAPPRAAFWDGVVAVSPLLLGVAPFGIVAGATVVEIGLDLPEAVGFSVVIFAGASQLAALDLLGRDATFVVAAVTALVINLRMLMYAASMAPHFASLSIGRRTVGAYLLTDQAYALTITRLGREPGFRDWFAFYLGAGTTLWVTWQVMTVVGVFVGDAVPESVPLDFAVPITFLALLVPAITDRPTLTAAVVGAAIATGGAAWPANVGMILGAVAGIAAGFLHSVRKLR